MANNKVGVLWKKKDKNEKEFFSGNLDLGVLGQIPVVVFKNNKAEENHPDFTIHLLPEE